MIPEQFAYAAPDGLEGVLELLAQADGEATLVAGGQSLIPMMRLRLAVPSLVVDLRKLSPALAYARVGNAEVSFGALTTHGQIEHDRSLSSVIPFMSGVASSIADPLVRTRGTIGGSIAHGDPAGDWPTVGLALGLEVRVRSCRGAREIGIDDLYVGPYSTSLEPDEVIVELRCPRLDGGAAGAYVKHCRHGTSDFAVVGCAVVLWGDRSGCSEARVAFAGLSGTPRRDRAVEMALRGAELAPAQIQAAAELAGSEGVSLGDHHASAEFRAHLARMCARRALATASDRLVGDERHGSR